MPDHPEERMERGRALRAAEDAQGAGDETAPRDEAGNLLGRPVEDRAFEAVETGASAAAGVGIGAAAGGPVGAAVGGVIGAALGAAAGEGVERAAGPAAEAMNAGPLPDHDPAQDEARDAAGHGHAPVQEQEMGADDGDEQPGR